MSDSPPNGMSVGEWERIKADKEPEPEYCGAVETIQMGRMVAQNIGCQKPKVFHGDEHKSVKRFGVVRLVATWRPGPGDERLGAPSHSR